MNALGVHSFCHSLSLSILYMNTYSVYDFGQVMRDFE